MTERQALERLGVKYEVLLRLRGEREQVIARGLAEFPEAEKLLRRQTMRTLAAEFPGVLRELDDADAGFLEERLTAIRQVLDGGVVESWMESAVLFHWALREALLVRREPGARLEVHKGGRLLDVVWLAVAERLGTTPRAAELLLYPKAPARGVRI